MRYPKGSETYPVHPKDGHRILKEGKVFGVIGTFFPNTEAQKSDQEPAPDIEIGRLYASEIGPNGANMFHTIFTNRFVIKTSDRAGDFCESELVNMTVYLREASWGNFFRQPISNPELMIRRAAAYRFPRL